jgi:hypothetical protein
LFGGIGSAREYTLLYTDSVGSDKNGAVRLASSFRIFIDDSGDPGFKFDKGSTRFFLIACVVFDNADAAEAASARMREIKRCFGWSIHHEAKFHTLRKDKLKVFLAEMAKLDFKIRAIVIDKPLIRNREMTSKKESFYNFAIKEVLARMDFIEDAVVRLDGHPGKKYQKQAVAYFRKAVNAKKHKIDDFKPVDSKKNELVQLADLVAGSIYHSLQDDKTDAADYLGLLKGRIDELWDFTGESRDQP